MALSGMRREGRGSGRMACPELAVADAAMIF